MNPYPNGVWPVMLTPFKADKSIDEAGLRALVDWYIDMGVDGLFAACQSSEIFHMDPQEQIRIARITVEQAAGRVPVVASGHTAYPLEDQARGIEAMAATGVDAVILITNRLARQEEPDAVLLRTVEELTKRISPDIRLGFYECPSPYKRLLSVTALKELIQNDRFYFLKDTCCDSAQIREKLAVIQGSNLKLYNANATTTLQSLRDGAAGYSGVMANFHPELYVWLCRNPQHKDADMVQNVLTMCSLIERQLYPTNAKYHLQAIEGLPTTITCRNQDSSLLTETFREEVRQMDALCNEVARKLGIG